MQTGKKVIPIDLLHTNQTKMQKQPSNQNIISLVSPTQSLSRIGKRRKSQPGPNSSMNRHDIQPVSVSQTSVQPAQKSTRDENGSVYSKSLKDRIGHFGNPIRGPVTTEMFVHYFYFLIILLVAYSTGWDNDIRAYMALVYMNLSLFTLEISRLVYAKRTNSVIPVYLSLPVFALLIVLSRSVHQIVMVLWYISFLLLCMQSGSSQLQLHFKIYTVVFMSLYLIMVCISLNPKVLVIMKTFYYKGCQDVLCGVELKYGIDYKQEVVSVVACLMVVVCCMMLERFIRRNALCLLERENYMRQLYFANVDLKKQLRLDNGKKEVDLEAPLSKATQLLKLVKDTADIDEPVQKEIAVLITLLSSDQLYSPDLYQKPADSDVHGWLNDMLTPSRNNKVSSSDIVPQIDVKYDFQVQAKVSEFDNEMFNHLTKQSQVPSYDVLEIDTISSGKGLYYYSWHVPSNQGYIRENPYHNSIHAADVTHSMHYYISRMKIWPHLTPEEQISSIIAPIIHDYAHPGVNNAFLVAVMDPLAIKYSDLSVLEFFHTSSVFELMQKDEYNFLENCSTDERKLIREGVIGMVLATDMTFHFDWIGKFKTKMNGGGLNMDQKTDRKLLLNMAIKCADVNNPSKPPEQSKRWTDLIMEEFFRQGDKEKARGLAVSMFMSRGQTDVPKCQIVPFISKHRDL